MTMATLAEVRAAIVARLQTVTDIGRVHDRERYAKNDGGFRALYHWDAPGADRPQVRGWFVVHRSSDRRQPRVNRVSITDSWQISGLVEFDDAGAPDHQIDELIEEITTVFSAEPTLGGVVKQLQDLAAGEEAQIGIQVLQRQPVMFAGILAVRADLGLVTYRFS
jgi:hypothetical protein